MSNFVHNGNTLADLMLLRSEFHSDEHRQIENLFTKAAIDWMIAADAEIMNLKQAVVDEQHLRFMAESHKHLTAPLPSPSDKGFDNLVKGRLP
jgi:hypothetical protein